MRNTRRKRDRKPRPKYLPLTRKLARWLMPLIDRQDWGYQNRGTPVSSCTNDELERFRRGEYWPQKFTMTLLQPHLLGEKTYYYKSNRASGYCLVQVDVDAHDGQTDALDAVELIASRFRGAYWELSTKKRGFHLYLLVHVGFIKRVAFNALLSRFETALGEFLVENNIQSTAEVLGRFTIIDGATGEVTCRAQPTKLPRPQTLDRVKALVNAPIFHAAHLEGFIAEQEVREHATIELDGCDTLIKADASDGSNRSSRDVSCAFERMKMARFEFTKHYNRDPVDVEELDAFYVKRWDAGEADKARLRRARWVLDHSTFDITASTDGGYATNREKLLKAVGEHVRPEHRVGVSYKFAISDEDLAVGLWVVTKNAFEVKENVSRQWTCPRASFSGMFKALKDEGVIDRGCARTDKIASIKAILERAGLALCIDDGYRFCPDRKDLGVGKKYIIGANHWRRDEFLEFCKDVSVVWIKAPRFNQPVDAPQEQPVGRILATAQPPLLELDGCDTFTKVDERARLTEGAGTQIEKMPLDKPLRFSPSVSESNIYTLQPYAPY